MLGRHTVAEDLMSRLHIDWTRCEGRGSCVELLPEVLDTTLAWRPGTVAHALEIDLIALFATIER